MPSIDSAPVKIDYDAYLSWESKNRQRSGLKALRPYFDRPGMISVSASEWERFGSPGVTASIADGPSVGTSLLLLPLPLPLPLPSPSPLPCLRRCFGRCRSRLRQSRESESS
jgi:hypothetical protein